MFQVLLIITGTLILRETNPREPDPRARLVRISLQAAPLLTEVGPFAVTSMSSYIWHYRSVVRCCV